MFGKQIFAGPGRDSGTQSGLCCLVPAVATPGPCSLLSSSDSPSLNLNYLGIRS